MPAFDKRVGDFEAANTQVLGISTDSPFSHENWAKTVGISRYPLLSDVQRSVVKEYGAYWPDGRGPVRPAGAGGRHDAARHAGGRRNAADADRLGPGGVAEDAVRAETKRRG